MHIFYVSINMFVNSYVKTDHMADMKYTMKMLLCLNNGVCPPVIAMLRVTGTVK